MKKFLNSKRVTGALAAVMAVALLLGGTFAWRDISQNAQNVFTATSYEAELVDLFNPPSNWEKDETINKDVYVKNTGSGDIFVRVNFDDILKLKGEPDQAQKPYNDFALDGSGAATTTSFNKFEWAMGNGLIYDMADWNGCTDAWFFDSTTGWFYWGNVLTSGTQTDKLLDAVKLLTDVDKDFEYIINVNMHAFSADQKGIEDLEDTDGGSANVPDEVKDMVNGIVSKSEAAAKDKAFEERVKEVYGTLPADKEIKTEADGTKHIIDKATGDYILDRVNFPDETFYEYVKQFDTDNDGKLSQAERDVVLTLDISKTKLTHGNLKDITGVELFQNTESLKVGYNRLNSIDVSNLTQLKVIYAPYNPLSEIKGLDTISANLEELNISSTDMSNVNLLSMPKLKLFSANNTSITSINLINSMLMEKLALSSTLIDTLDISNCAKLTSLEIMDTDISVLDVSNNTRLVYLYIYRSNISSIDLGGVPIKKIGIDADTQITNFDTTVLNTIRICKNDGEIRFAADLLVNGADFYETYNSNSNPYFQISQSTPDIWSKTDSFKYGKNTDEWFFTEPEHLGNTPAYLTKNGVALAIGGTLNGNVIDLTAGDQVVTTKGIYTLTSTGTLASDGTITAASADWTPVNTLKNYPSDANKTLAQASGATVAATVVGGELTNHK